MITLHDPRDVVRSLISWATERDEVRAMLLTSSRVSPHACVDALSDYDVVLVVVDIRPFYVERSWLEDFGQVLVAYWDPLFPDPQYGIEQTGNVTQYADGLKIDFRLWPVPLMDCIAHAAVLPTDLDAGYTILLDKDGLTCDMKSPQYQAYILPKPTEQTFRTSVEEFLSDAPYVAKCLWRDELLPAKWCLDFDMKHVYLRPMLEWRMECDHTWLVPVGNLGKGLKKGLPPDIWRDLEATYVGADIEDNWDALFRTMALFRRVATDVAQHLGYIYPHDLHDGVSAYVREMKALDHATDQFP